MRSVTQNDVTRMVRAAQRDGVTFTALDDGGVRIETPESINGKWHGKFSGLKPFIVEALDIIKHGGIPSDFDPPVIRRYSIGEMAEAYPVQKPPVVDGLFRESETVNIIAGSKSNKTWTLYGLLLCIVMGWRWLDRFDTSVGKCLLVDNELHRPTIPHRIRTVADAMGIAPEQYENDIDVISLRGELRSLSEIRRELKRVPPGTYKAIAFDAEYRMFPEGSNENSNSDVTQFYNEVDQLAAETGSAVLLIHHASKGDQSSKKVTDVGAGAGAQSRATDCHLVLREHEADNRVVLDAVVRSFKPVSPMVLAWQFPLWVPDETADPEKLAGNKSKQQQHWEAQHEETDKTIIRALVTGPATNRKLREVTGFGKDRVQSSLDRLKAAEQIDYTTTKIRGNECHEYFIPDSPV